MRALTPDGAAKGAVVAMPKRTRFANTRSGFDYLIVGAGFAGSVLAERLAAGLDKRVLLIDRRPHIAGNAYDHYNDAGLLIHRYGPHIFHTNSTQVVELPVALHQVAPLRAQGAGPCGRAACADPDQPDHAGTALRPEADAGGRRSLPEVQGGAGRRDPHVRGCRGQLGRAGAVREVLPGLHPQAVGPGPVGAGQVGDLARADPDQHRRPLLRRQLPEHAAARLHPDVREHARPSRTSRSC